MKKKIEGFKIYVLLHLVIVLYSIIGIFSKSAAENEFMSKGFIGSYLMVLLLLCIYALFWQQILKHISLITASLNKSITIIWGMFFGVIVFDENINTNMIVGAGIVLLGVGLVVTDQND